MHPAEELLINVFRAVPGPFEGDFVMCARAVAPAGVVGELRHLVLLGGACTLWTRCDDESPAQFRQRAADAALAGPRLPGDFGHIRILVELPKLAGAAFDRERAGVPEQPARAGQIEEKPL